MYRIWGGGRFSLLYFLRACSGVRRLNSLINVVLFGLEGFSGGELVGRGQEVLCLKMMDCVSVKGVGLVGNVMRF